MIKPKRRIKLTPADAAIVSPIFPSGVTLILNALVELDVLIVRGPSPVFQRKRRGYVLHEKQQELLRWLPSLGDREVFAFAPSPAVRWVHDWACEVYVSQPCVFMTRHGIDAVYSYAKRNRPDITPADFLGEAYAMHEVSPIPLDLGLTAPEMWALYTASWLDALGDNAQVVRFEDVKRDPMAARASLRALGIDPDDDAIARAFDRSSVERARESEQSHMARSAGDSGPPMIRAGITNEWETRNAEADAAAFAGLPHEVLERLEYKTPPCVTVNAHESDPTELALLGGVIDRWGEAVSHDPNRRIATAALSSLHRNLQKTRATSHRASAAARAAEVAGDGQAAAAMRDLAADRAQAVGSPVG